jgi:hypothetical protein
MNGPFERQDRQHGLKIRNFGQERRAGIRPTFEAFSKQRTLNCLARDWPDKDHHQSSIDCQPWAIPISSAFCTDAGPRAHAHNKLSIVSV